MGTKEILDLIQFIFDIQTNYYQEKIISEFTYFTH